MVTKYITLLCFFATGITGLLYELVWLRMLILAFGSTQFAVTTVLTTFMAGLAIGSLFFGRLIDRYQNPLKAYGIMEIILGGYCLLTPHIFSFIQNLYLTTFSGNEIHYASFNLNQFVLAFAGIIIPTTLMGGTLPILTKYFAMENKRIGFSIGALYSINTLGAVLGCIATGFFLLHLLGVSTTVYLAGGADIGVGILILLISFYHYGYGAHYEKHPSPSSYPGYGGGEGRMTRLKQPIASMLVLAIFALSGFAALSYEVLWTRMLSLIIGSSIYAFTIMLAIFLSGIGIGSIMFAPFTDKIKAPLLWFALLELIIGFSVILSIPLYSKLPFIFLKLHVLYSHNFWLFLLSQFILCSAIMIIPTLCMGAIFPIVGKIYTAQYSQKVGRGIGNIYFFNTLGAIFGSFVSGFVLIPSLGIQHSIIIVSAISALLGIALLLLSERTILKRAVAAVIIILAFTIFAYNTPPWSKMIMTMGPYANPIDKSVAEALKTKGQYGELLFYKEGINAIITVRKEADGRTVSYQSNGKYEARAVDSKPGKAWSLLGHIPLLLSKKTGHALLIGIGSGITLGAMEQYPLKEIDVVELEPAVVEAAAYFAGANNNALDDSRVRLHITDGRNFLFTAKKKYDVIVSAVSDPWITGVSNLFTKEYFYALNNKLRDEGIAALWFQNYRISTDDLKTGLNTFASVFPYVSLWFHYTGTSDLIVIGSNHPHGFELESLLRKMSMEPVRKDLARIDIANPFDVLNLFLMGNNDMRNYVGRASVNTDNHPVLEFTLPRHLYSDPGSGPNERVVDMLSSTQDFIPLIMIPEKAKEDFYYKLGMAYSIYVFRTGQAIQLFEKTLAINPNHKQARQYLDALRNEQKRGR